MLRFMKNPLREQYEKAQQLGKMAFAERPYFGSPAAPAQAETNASQIWGHINSGFLIGYEYSRWWKESLALRQAAVLGDVQRLPNGNTLVAYSTSGVLHQVNAAGELVQELTWPIGGAFGFVNHRPSLYGPPALP
jgi:hypothetical protein